MKRLILITVLAVVACGGGTETQVSPTAPATSSVPVSATTEPPATEPTAEPVATEPAATFEDIALKGEGDDVARFTLPPEMAAIVKFIHGSPDGNFSVWSIGPGGDQVDLLVNTIGRYAGTVLLNESGDEVVAFDISATGPWAALIRPIERAPAWNPAEPLSGAGDAVYRVTPPIDGLYTALLASTAEDNFSIWSYGPDGRDLTVNDIAPYSGEVILPAGTFLLAIEGSDWSITPG